MLPESALRSFESPPACRTRHRGWLRANARTEPALHRRRKAEGSNSCRGPGEAAMVYLSVTSSPARPRSTSTVKEPPFLLAVQGQVGRIDVQNDLLRSLVVRFKEHFHHQFVHRLFPEGDLLVSILRARPQLHPVQRAFPRQRFARFLPPRQHAEQRVGPEQLMIVNVFIAQRQAVDPLREHLLNRVFDQLLVAGVEKTLRQARQQIQTAIGLAQQQCAPAELIVTPSKRAMISREPQASNPKLDSIHSVIAKAVLSLALTAVWKLSYATKDGLLPNHL